MIWIRTKRRFPCISQGRLRHRVNSSVSQCLVHDSAGSAIWLLSWRNHPACVECPMDEFPVDEHLDFGPGVGCDKPQPILHCPQFAELIGLLAGAPLSHRRHRDPTSDHRETYICIEKKQMFRAIEQGIMCYTNIK